MGILSQNFYKNRDSNSTLNKSKIPDYAREYKREYQFIRGINKEFKYLIDFKNNCNNNFKSYKLDRIMKFIKIFLRAQEKGRLKDISNLEFNYDDVDNIIDLIKNLPEYFCFIQNHYDWRRGDDDESLISHYEIYKDDLELFLSKLNVEIEYSDCDSDSDSDTDYNIIFPDSDNDISFSYSDSDSDSDDDL